MEINKIICEAITNGFYYKTDSGDYRLDTKITYIDFVNGVITAMADVGNYLDVCYFRDYGKLWACKMSDFKI